MHPYTKTLPHPTEVDQPYWDALRRHQLLIQRCRHCRTWQWYPREICCHCQSFDLGWEPAEPFGHVYSHSTQYQKTGSRFDVDVPYTVVLVELEEPADVRLVGRLTGIDPQQVHIGMPVAGRYVDATDEITLLEFVKGAPHDH